MTVAALLALAGATALLIVSLFQGDGGLTFIWLSLAADALALTLLVLALRKRFPPATRRR